MKELIYEKILFGYTSYSGLWGVVDNKLVYDYVNLDLFNKLFSFYSKALWQKEIQYLNELSALEIVKFQKCYQIKYPIEVNALIKNYENGKKYDLILAMTQYFNDEYEESFVFLHKRNLFYLSLILDRQITDYSELNKSDFKQLEETKIVLYETADDAYHSTKNKISLNNLMEKLSPNTLYQNVIELIRNTGKISIPIIQREFNVEYSEAIQIMEQLENGQIVSKVDENGERKVLI